MRRYLTYLMAGFLLFSFLFLPYMADAQATYAEIDAHAVEVPAHLSSYQEITDHLVAGLDAERDMARAIYIWISHNIHYDLGRMGTQERFFSVEEVIHEALEERKGLCQHYSELFLAMSRYVGLDSYLVTGYTRNSRGMIDELPHAWNAVFLSGEYLLIDATWASGFLKGDTYVHQFRDKYFLIEPLAFIRDHMPFDPIWQGLEEPVSHRAFLDGNPEGGHESSPEGNLEKGAFRYADSIRRHMLLDELSMMLAENRRIESSVQAHPMIRFQYDENQLHITNGYYNRAADSLNYGIERYNTYVTAKNRQFRQPELEDEEIRQLIGQAAGAVRAADRILASLSSADPGLDALIRQARRQIPELLQLIEQEEAWAREYLGS